MIKLGQALTIAAGTSMENYLVELIMYPIGIKNWTWWSEEALPDGLWNGQQVLPEGWVKEATVNQVQKTLALADTDHKATDGRGIYGYNWWVIRNMESTVCIQNYNNNLIPA